MHVPPKIEVRDLVLAQAIVLHGSVTKAARHLGLSQSAVSHALTRLEEKLGTALVTREGRGIAVTHAGKKLARESDRILAQLVGLERSLVDDKPARLALATQCHTAYDWLAPILAKIDRSHPLTRVQVRVDCTRSLHSALNTRRIDLAICHSEMDPAFNAVPLGVDPFVAVLPVDHPAANSDAVRPKELRDDILLVHEMEASEMQAFAKTLFDGKPPARAMRLPVTEAIVELVASGYGVSIMPGWVSRQAQRRDDVVVRPLLKKGAARTWTAVTRGSDGEREDIRSLIAALKDWFDMRAFQTVAG